MCAECGGTFSHLRRHIKRMHSVKHWGFQCPCGFNASQVDVCIFSRHVSYCLGDKDIDELKVFVTGGYKKMVECEQCKLQFFNLEHVQAHYLHKHQQTFPHFELTPADTNKGVLASQFQELSLECPSDTMQM